MQLARFVDTHMDYVKNHALLLEILTYLDKCLNMFRFNCVHAGISGGIPCIKAEACRAGEEDDGGSS